MPPLYRILTNWNRESAEVRWMTSFYKRPEEVMDFVEKIRQAVGAA
jgi:hypothetical protein